LTLTRPSFSGSVMLVTTPTTVPWRMKLAVLGPPADPSTDRNVARGLSPATSSV